MTGTQETLRKAYWLAPAICDRVLRTIGSKRGLDNWSLELPSEAGDKRLATLSDLSRLWRITTAGAWLIEFTVLGLLPTWFHRSGAIGNGPYVTIFGIAVAGTTVLSVLVTGSIAVDWIGCTRKMRRNRPLQ